MKQRCAWAGKDPLMVAYHDREWGLPLHDDTKLFEFLCLEIQSEFGSFDNYIWAFVGHRPIQNQWKRLDQLPATSPESLTMSKDMRKRGFKFVGPTICYAMMQAIGMVNDHTDDCFRHQEIIMQEIWVYSVCRVCLCNLGKKSLSIQHNHNKNRFRTAD
jgi:3-methyladenine DNA glycosylase Tag